MSDHRHDARGVYPHEIPVGRAIEFMNLEIVFGNRGADSDGFCHLPARYQFLDRAVVAMATQ